MPYPLLINDEERAVFMSSQDGGKKGSGTGKGRNRGVWSIWWRGGCGSSG